MKRFKRRWIAILVLLLTGIHGCCAGEDAVKSLTYAVYPYLPDVGYYQELVERRWAEIEPEIELVRAEWNCYEDGEPLGIDVIMYPKLEFSYTRRISFCILKVLNFLKNKGLTNVTLASIITVCNDSNFY